MVKIEIISFAKVPLCIILYLVHDNLCSINLAFQRWLSLDLLYCILYILSYFQNQETNVSLFHLSCHHRVNWRLRRNFLLPWPVKELWSSSRIMCEASFSALQWASSNGGARQAAADLKKPIHYMKDFVTRTTYLKWWWRWKNCVNVNISFPEKSSLVKATNPWRRRLSLTSAAHRPRQGFLPSSTGSNESLPTFFSSRLLEFSSTKEEPAWTLIKSCCVPVKSGSLVFFF